MAAVPFVRVPGTSDARQGKNLKQYLVGIKDYLHPGTNCQNIYLYSIALWAKRTIQTILGVNASFLLVCFFYHGL